MRKIYCLLTVLLLWSPAMGREIFVNNAMGDDRFSGQQARDGAGLGGPVRTLAKALRLARAGDTIVLAKTDAPYRESISLVGSRYSGTSQQPFVIQGNGAILDGSTPALPKRGNTTRARFSGSPDRRAIRCCFSTIGPRCACSPLRQPKARPIFSLASGVRWRGKSTSVSNTASCRAATS